MPLVPKNVQRVVLPLAERDYPLSHFINVPSLFNDSLHSLRLPALFKLAGTLCDGKNHLLFSLESFTNQGGMLQPALN